MTLDRVIQIVRFRCDGNEDAEKAGEILIGFAETLMKALGPEMGSSSKSIGSEPTPDELPIMDERRVIMTRKQFVGACLWVASVRNQHGYDAQQLVSAFDAYVKKCHE